MFKRLVAASAIFCLTATAHGQADPKLTPPRAKTALLLMMLSKAGQDLGWFEGDVPEKMDKIEVKEEKDGWYSWTAAFRFHPDKAIYKLVIAPEQGARGCILEYEGRFILKDNAWTATPPKLVRTILLP